MAGMQSGQSGVRGGVFAGGSPPNGAPSNGPTSNGTPPKNPTPPPVSRRPASTSGTIAAVSVPNPRASNPVIRSESAPRVLLIEDEPVSRGKLEQMLQRRGAEVVSVAGPSEAIYALQTMEEWPARPVMVILDVLMPGLDGPLFVAMLRQEPKIGGAPIVLISALAPAVLERTMHDWAADGFILKSRGLLHIDQAFDAWIARLKARSGSGAPSSRRADGSGGRGRGSSGSGQIGGVGA